MALLVLTFCLVLLLVVSSVLVVWRADVRSSAPRAGNQGGAAGAPIVSSAEIAFLTDRENSQLWEIYLMTADGTRQRRLTERPLRIAGASTLSWSPDGRRIVFDRGTGKGSSEIAILDSGTNLLTVLRLDVSATFSPAWSPDGKLIAFFDSEGDLFLVNTDGSKLRRISHSGAMGGHLHPAWSPDGKKLAFTCDCPNAGIYSINLDGTGMKRLIEGSGLRPAWSPDGSKIAFLSRAGQIYVTNADGSQGRRLTNDGENFSPNWSPDGRYISFVSDRDGNLEIYVMRSNGAQETRLTTNRVIDDAPVWR